MIKILCLTLLGVYSESSSLGERFFVGALSGLVISIFVYFIGQRKAKKQEKRRTALQDIFEEKENLEREKQYFNTLKNIAEMSGSQLYFNYELTVSQLLEKCNPKYFIESKDCNKLGISTSIYSELLSIAKPYDKEQIRKIRKRASEQLGVSLESEDTFKLLEKVFNPMNFVDENFEADKFLACSKAHMYILENRSDLRKLEQFAYKIGLLKL